ncbi:ribonucleoside triphosphate reductase [Pelagicoccus sp. SDUM812003]|uniref:ribonucleoside triphosphate reductase n=1 Tax=Pelagicoccus sp. SDUM812003 TaxID=3041267 RepID=UPI00280EDC95|nr:ribonucleoside triphosphate reductase [Pelagicoccus sp. SDUM812003]MDQ8203190.1 ribonucleoside triphosphate reductase [Pelagicoccus sp. SDUM812003]
MKNTSTAPTSDSSLLRFHLSDRLRDRLQLALKESCTPFSATLYANIAQRLQRQERDGEILNEYQVAEEELAAMGMLSALKAFWSQTKDEGGSEASGESRDSLVSVKHSISEYIDKVDWRINANANVGYSHAGLINQSAGKLIANYWLDQVYTEEEGEAHRSADIHIHDLDSLSGYCAGWSLRVLLDEGFNGVAGRVSSRPANHFNEALGQMANFLGILQSEWAGAQAFSSFDTYLAPLLFKDQLDYKETKKAIRRFVYNLNVPARWGQSPFTNITLDFTPPQDLANQYPSRNYRHLFENVSDEKLEAMAQKRGVEKLTDLRYKHFQKEMEMIDIAYYEVMTEGDSCEQPFTFPIPTVNITEDFDWDSPAADALFENTAKVGNSYFQNFLGSLWMYDEEGNKVPNPDAYQPNAVRSMCCRLQLDLRELLKRGNGLFGSAEMTGSIGVVTINLARLGYRFRDDWDGLKEETLRLMKLAKGTLEKKRAFVQTLFDRGLFPYSKRYLSHFRNHFSTIGINGMNEMLQNFSDGRIDIATTEGERLAIELLDMIRETMKAFQEETGNLYNLEATPAEGTTYRFAKEDRKRFPGIIQSGDGENIYYTNSSQLPAGFTDDPFYALEKQDALQTKYTGGTVLHLYMDEKLESGQSCKRFVKSALTNFRLPYLTITPVFSVCDDHGYLKGEQECCPQCGKDTHVWTRVMGYHRPVSSFNRGKKGEHKERKHFSLAANPHLPLFE